MMMSVGGRTQLAALVVMNQLQQLMVAKMLVEQKMVGRWLQYQQQLQQQQQEQEGEQHWLQPLNHNIITWYNFVDNMNHIRTRSNRKGFNIPLIQLHCWPFLYII